MEQQRAAQHSDRDRDSHTNFNSDGDAGCIVNADRNCDRINWYYSYPDPSADLDADSNHDGYANNCTTIAFSNT